MNVNLTLASKLLLCAGALATTLQAGAQDLPAGAAEEPVRRYSVELIVFTYDSSVSAGTEVFVADKPDPVAQFPNADDRTTASGLPTQPLEDARDAVREFGDTLPEPGKLEPGDEVLGTLLRTSSLNLRLLGADELTLGPVHDKLRRLDAYNPVMWTGWEQDVREDELTPKVDLRRLGNLPLAFSGDMKLYLGRFLHLVANVKMEAPGSRSGFSTQPRSYRARPARALDRQFDYAADGLDEPRPIYYRINDNRIMKSGDLRYFDHPKFGILAKLTRMEDAPQPGVDDDTDALQPVGVEATALPQ